MNDERPRITLITRTWDDDGDGASLTRLIAGALALHGDVEIVHLTDVEVASTVTESVFSIHAVPLVDAHPARSAIAVAATEAIGSRTIPDSVIGLLERWEGSAPAVPDTLRRLAPDIVVLVGSSQPFDLGALGSLPTDPTVLFVPMTDGTSTLASERFSALVARSDVVGSIHPGEDRELRRLFPTSTVRPLDVALPLNRGATDQGLFGVGWFGDYVVLIRRFPALGGRYVDSVTHDVMRGALGKIAVAEVDGTKWRISDAENTADLPVNPTRVNLWRLMANGLMTIDLRPPDLFGREAVESMMLGTPVVVPDGSAAMEHVAAASGGVWYHDLGEILDGSRALLDPPIRSALGESGRAYAVAHHGDMDGFVARVGALVGL